MHWISFSFFVFKPVVCGVYLLILGLNVKLHFSEVPEIKEEIDDEIPTRTKRKRVRKCSGLDNYDASEASGTNTRTQKQKKTDTGDKLIVRIRNKKEKLAAAVALEDEEVENEDSRSDKIKTEPV